MQLKRNDLLILMLAFLFITQLSQHKSQNNAWINKG